MTDSPAAGLPRAGARGARNEGPLRFGERMTGVEALMWRLGRHDDRFRATMSLVVTLEGSVPLPALRLRLRRLCESVPRLRDRVREPALSVVTPSWEPDPGFRVENHVQELHGCLWDVASLVVGTPFDDEHPPWRVVVVPAAGPAGDGVVLHLHHSYTDGLGGMRLLGELFDLSPDSPGSPGSPGEAGEGEETA